MTPMVGHLCPPTQVPNHKELFVALKVVEAFEKNGEWFGTRIQGNSGVVCFASTAPPVGGDWSASIMELQNESKRAAVVEAGRRGMSSPCLEPRGSAPYAVDANGDQVVNPLAQKIAAFHIDVQVTGRIG